MGNDLVLKVTIPSNLIGDMVVKGIAHVINDCTIEPFLATEKAVETAEPQVVQAVAVDRYADKGLKFIEEEKQKRVVKKLIKFVCMDCKEINFAVIERVDGAYKITCRDCGQDYEFRERELVKAEYTCPECNRTNVYFTPEVEHMNIATDNCVCGAHNKMRYDAEAGIYVLA